MEKPKDYRKEPFKRLVILGESTVQGGAWLARKEDRFADVLVQLLDSCQEKPIEYFNKGIGANTISPLSPGYEASAKPSAMERYKSDVIDHQPDLFILCYGLNDIRAGMPVSDFEAEVATILSHVKEAGPPVIVLTTVYYMTGWKSYPPFDKGSVELTLDYNAAIRGLAERFDCILADIWSAEEGADWLVHPDGVHANKVGNMVIANKIFEALARHCSCLTNREFELAADTKWTQGTTAQRKQDGDPFVKTW